MMVIKPSSRTLLSVLVGTKIEKLKCCLCLFPMTPNQHRAPAACGHQSMSSSQGEQCPGGKGWEEEQGGSRHHQQLRVQSPLLN